MSGGASGGLRHFLQFSDLDRPELDWVFERSRIIKDRFKRYQFYQPLTDRTLAMVFEKASTRTRVSFEAGMYQMAGRSFTSRRRFAAWPRRANRRHCAGDFPHGRHRDDSHLRASEARKVRRAFASSRDQRSDQRISPVSILADIFTFIEHRGPIAGRCVAWIGDANNMAYTWIQAARSLGFQLNISTPPGYPLDAARAAPGEHLRVFENPLDAARDASLLTTDVWTSMGYEAENDARCKAFADWASTRDARCGAQRRCVHALPARTSRRGSYRRGDRWRAAVVWDEPKTGCTCKSTYGYLLLGRNVK